MGYFVSKISIYILTKGQSDVAGGYIWYILNN